VADHFLFKAQGVAITPTVARFGNTSYQIANIGSVAVNVRHRLPGAALFFYLLAGAGAVLGLALLLSLALVGNHQQDAGLIVLGVSLVSLVIAIVWANKWPIREYTMVFTTSSSDLQVLISRDREYVMSIRDAIEAAFPPRA
jgi:hypothetical protein